MAWVPGACLYGQGLQAMEESLSSDRPLTEFAWPRRRGRLEYSKPFTEVDLLGGGTFQYRYSNTRFTAHQGFVSKVLLTTYARTCIKTSVVLKKP